MVDVIVERCAGLDVHRDTVVATVRVPGSGKSRRRRVQETRTFGTTIGQLERLSEWLAECGVTRVGMESTGCYWKTVFYALEDRFDCWLVNAKHLRNVPGRKSDVIDSRWCCELVELGLVRPSFVPPPEIRRLRDLTRLRSTQVQERTRSIERLEKVLQDAGIKLTSVASGVYSASARAMLEALLGGHHRPGRPSRARQGTDPNEDPAASGGAREQVRHQPPQCARRGAARPHRRARPGNRKARGQDPDRDRTPHRPDRARLHDPRPRRADR